MENPPPYPPSKGNAGPYTTVAVQEERRRRCTPGRVCCWLCCFLVLLLLTLGITVLVLYLVLKPKEPTVSVNVTGIRSLNVSSPVTDSSLQDLLSQFNNDSATLVRVMGVLSYNVTVENRNKYSLNVKSVRAAIFYKDHSIGNSTLPAFKVGSRETYSTLGDLAMDAQISGPLASDFLSSFLGGTISLVSRIMVKGAADIWGISSPTVKVNARCDVDIDITSQTVKDQSCKVTDVGV